MEIFSQNGKPSPWRLRSTMCIVHKGFRGFRALYPASILGGNLIGLNSAIPYNTIHSTLVATKKKIKVEENFKIANPEIEAEIYYLTENEGGRKTAVKSGYRGQFYYDGRDWDAPQEFIDKEFCEPGEKVSVKMQTLSPDFHVGRFWIGKEFKIREGARIVGNGKIKRIVREDFRFWEYESAVKELPKDCKPYDKENIEGFVFDFEYLLGAIEGVKEVNCKINLSNKEEMIRVNCEIEDVIKRPRPLIDEICKSWREELGFKQSKYKTELNFKDDKFKFVLSFITWHSMFLTGKIIIEK